MNRLLRRSSGRQHATATPRTPRCRAGCVTWARRLDFDVWIAANDRSRSDGSGQLADGCLTPLPAGVHVGLKPSANLSAVWVFKGAA